MNEEALLAYWGIGSPDFDPYDFGDRRMVAAPPATLGGALDALLRAPIAPFAIGVGVGLLLAKVLR